MSHKYFFLVGPNVVTDNKAPSTLFIYETDNDDDKGKYTVYHRNKERQEDWQDWLENRYFPPHQFVNRFGYSAVHAGPLRDEDHFQELLRKAGIVNKEEVNDNSPS